MNHMDHGPMKDSMKSHILWMAGGGGVLLLIFLASGFDFQAALPIALSLACPLGMVGMMIVMGRSMRHDNARDDAQARDHDHERRHEIAGTHHPEDRERQLPSRAPAFQTAALPESESATRPMAADGAHAHSFQSQPAAAFPHDSSADEPFSESEASA